MTKEAQYDVNHQFNIFSIMIYRDSWLEKDKLDIKNMMLQFDIFEDMFSGSMTAKLAMLDMTNIVDNFPIVGGERIDLLYNVPSEKEMQTLQFVVGSVGNRVRPMTQSQYQGVVLNLVTPDRYKDVNFDLSMAFQGPYSEIVKTILSKLTKKNVVVDTSLYSQTYIAPYQSPLKCCRQISERTIGPKFEPYFFYETSTSYNFRSILQLYKQVPYCKLFIQPGKSANIPPEKLRRKVIEYSDAKTTDRIRQTFEYGFGSNAVILDTTSKRFTEQSHDYEKMAASPDFAKVDKYPLVDNMDNNRTKYEFIQGMADKSHEGYHYKQMIRALIDNYRYKVLVPGDSGFHVGQIIELDVPDVSITKYKREQTTSGKWIVGSLKHSIKRDSFLTTLELLKDSHVYDIAAKVKGKPTFDAARSATGSQSPDPVTKPSDAPITT